jgi:hypothetical protein
MATDFLLNCFVLGDEEDNVLTVKIPKTDNVSILKDEVKKKNAPHLITEPALRPNKRLFSLWHGNPSDDDLHILVKAPGMLQAFLFQLF